MLLEYHLDWIKIVDSLLIAKFLASPDNYATPSKYTVSNQNTAGACGFFLFGHSSSWYGASCRGAFVTKNGQTVFSPKGSSPWSRGASGETQVLANSIYCGLCTEL